VAAKAFSEIAETLVKKLESMKEEKGEGE